MGTSTRRAAAALGLVAALAVGCYDEPDPGRGEYDVVVDTRDEQAWAQYLENLRYARDYAPRCRRDDPSRPGVLVTGFGRFGHHRDNATGQMVAGWLDELDYPWTEPPSAGEVDRVAPQVAVAQGVTYLEGVGEVDVCAMVLPVFWDLAAILVLREVEAFGPDMTLMNGIAGPAQPLWIEMGGINRTARLDDGSGQLRPWEDGGPVVEGGPEACPNRASWQVVRDAARAAIDAEATTPSGDERFEPARVFGEVVPDALLAAYPRPSNTYLCNNTTYAVNYAFDRPDETFRLLEASHPREGHDAGVEVHLDGDFAGRPRLFVHWPSELHGEHLASGLRVMRAMVAAQLATDEPVVRGDNDLAELDAQGLGPTY